MLDQVEWIVLIVAALAGSVGVGRRSLVLIARLRGRAVRARLTCPKRGCRVDCALLLDEAGGRYVGVERCSACPGGVPDCEEACAELLNIGIPLDAARRDRGRAPPPRPIAIDPED